MRLPEAIRAIKEKISLVDIVGRYVELKRNGLRFSGPCPFHQETKPSFSVNEEKGFFYCFGCQATGDLFEFYSRINGIDFRESVEQLAREAGISVEFGDGKAGRKKEGEKGETTSMLDLHKFAASVYAENLAAEDGREAREYLKGRETDPGVMEKFELGWAPRDWHFLEKRIRKRGLDLNLAVRAGLLSTSENGNFYDRFRGRLMFPIRNLSGQTIAFGGRIITNTDEAKYINSSESPIYKKKENLYGLFQARRSITTQGEAMITEGYMDVLTLHQFQYSNSVAALGTALTEEQVKRLSGFCSRFILIFDGDKPGRKAALRASAMILAAGMACKVALLPPEHDIDSLLKEEGRESFEAILGKAPDGLRFCVDFLREMAPREAVDWAKNFLANVAIPEIATRYASRLAAFLNMEESSLRLHAAQSGRGRKVQARASFPGFSGRDEQILICAVRYPERLPDLREMGAELALSTTEARQFWEKLASCEPEVIMASLDESQRAFWQAHRGPGAAPLTNAELELATLKSALDEFFDKTRKASITRAIAETCATADFSSQLECLRALQQTLEKTDEQS